MLGETKGRSFCLGVSESLKADPELLKRQGLHFLTIGAFQRQKGAYLIQSPLDQQIVCWGLNLRGCGFYLTKGDISQNLFLQTHHFPS